MKEVEKLPIPVSQIKKETEDMDQHGTPPPPSSPSRSRSSSGQRSEKRRRTENTNHNNVETAVAVGNDSSTTQGDPHQSNDCNVPMSSTTGAGDINNQSGRSRSRTRSRDRTPQAVSSPRPVQIISFEDDGQSGSSKMRLDLQVLKPILEKGGDRPAVIISIVGQIRRGKSLFLNFILHHLVAQEKGTNPEEIWKEGNGIPVGFEWGRGFGTSGIYLWSQPIILRLGDEECAIFLMDTAGLMFSKISEFMWTLGLSTLLSSCLIFNQDVERGGGLNEDYFLLFSDQVQVVLKSTKLQTLLFLMRDCSSISNLLGKIDPQPFLHQQFNLDAVQEPNSSSAPTRRPSGNRNSSRIKTAIDSLSTAFERSECYCLPFPFVSTNCRGAESEMTSTFISIMKSTLGNMLSTENLKPKKLGSSAVTSASLAGIFELLVQLFNNAGSSFPQNPHIQECLKEIEDGIFIQEQLKLYQQKLNAYIQNSRYGFTSREQHNAHHLKLRNEILETTKLHSFAHPTTSYNLVQHLIDDKYKISKAENDKTVRAAYTQGFWDHFDTSMEEWEKLIREAITQWKIDDDAAKNIEAICLENFKKKFTANAQQLAERLSTALLEKIQRRYELLKAVQHESRTQVLNSSSTTCENCKIANHKAEVLNNFHREMLRSLPIGQFVMPEQYVKIRESIVCNLPTQPHKLELSDFLPAFKVEQERNARNAPVLGFFVDGTSLESLCLKFCTFYANGEIATVDPTYEEELPFVGRLERIRQIFEDALDCALTQAIVVTSSKLKLSTTDTVALETKLIQSGFKLVYFADEYSALMLTCITTKFKLVENRILTAILVLDNGDGTVDVQSFRASESAIEVGKEGMTGLRIGTEEEARESMDRIKRLANRWLENDKRPFLLVVRHSCEGHGESQGAKSRKFRTNTFFTDIHKTLHIADFSSMEKSKINVGVAAFGELMRRRQAGTFSLQVRRQQKNDECGNQTDESVPAAASSNNSSLPVQIEPPLGSGRGEPAVASHNGPVPLLSLRIEIPEKLKSSGDDKNKRT